MSNNLKYVADIIGKLNTKPGMKAQEAFAMTQQLADYLEIHCNPFGQEKHGSSKYSVKEISNTVAAPPINNIGPTSFKGGRKQINVATVTSDAAYKYSGLAIDTSKPLNSSVYNIHNVTSVGGEWISFSSAGVTFPDSSEMLMNSGEVKPWRNVNAGINLKVFAAPGATATGILHAMVIPQDSIDLGSSYAHTIAQWKDLATATWESPVTAGCTIRAPLTTEHMDFKVTRDVNTFIMFIVQWDADPLSMICEVERIDQLQDRRDISPAQGNIDSSMFREIMAVVDYGSGSNPFGIAHVPLIVSGNSFWTKSKNIVNTITKFVKNNPKLIESLLSAGSVLF
jgi:hypothetical protein